MFIRIRYILFVAAVIALSNAYPVEEELSLPPGVQIIPLDEEEIASYFPENEELYQLRSKRSPRPDDKDEEEKRKQGWEFKPDLGRGDDGNTRGDVQVKRTGEKHDFEAGWSKVVNGPNKAKPTWHVGGTFRW